MQDCSEDFASEQIMASKWRLALNFAEITLCLIFTIEAGVSQDMLGSAPSSLAVPYRGQRFHHAHNKNSIVVQ